jgi:hypothetical protein
MPKTGGIGGVIGVGCGLMVFVIVALSFGGAFIVMQARAHVEVRAQTRELTLAHLPRVVLAGRIQVDTLAAQRAIAAFTLSEDDARIAEARARIAALEKHLEDLQGLSQKSEHPEDRETRAIAMKTLLAEWGLAIDQLETTLADLIRVREQADNAAADCIAVTREYLKREQAAALDLARSNAAAKILPRLSAMALTQDILDAAGNARMALWRGEARRESALVPQALEALDRLSSSMLALRAMVEVRDDLDTLEQSIEKYRDALSLLIEQRATTREAINRQSEYGRRLLEDAQDMLKEALNNIAAIAHDAVKRLGGATAGS